MKRSLLVPVVVSVSMLVPMLGASAAPAPADHQSSRHHQAVELSNRLLDETPGLKAETQVSTAPTNRMQEPPDRSLFSNLVSGERFWTDPQSMKTVLEELTAETPGGLRNFGGGELSTNGRFIERSSSYEVNPRPYDIYLGWLLIEVASTGKNHQHSAIGAYTEVVPFPKRPKSEHVSASVATATLSESEQGKPTRTRFLNAKQTHRLVVAFDKLRVQPPGGVYSCPVPSPGYSGTTVAFAGAKRLVSDAPGCGGMNVTAKSGRTPNLDATGNYDNTLSKVWREAKSTQVETG